MKPQNCSTGYVLKCIQCRCKLTFILSLNISVSYISSCLSDIMHARHKTLCLFYLLFTFSNGSASTLPELDLWPLVTPMLGDISEECIEASTAYVNNLNSALATIGDVTNKLDEAQLNALKMFDSNGPLPFLQEGMLQDVRMVDWCGVIVNLLNTTVGGVDFNCNILFESIRYVAIPYGNANGPGLQSECRSVPSTKYCTIILL